MKQIRILAAFVVGFIAVSTVTRAANAQYLVQVGYADGIRGGGFFPSPWDGDPGVAYFDGTSIGAADAGAIRIINMSGAPISVDDISVTFPAYPTTYHLWGSHILPSGESGIYTETAHYNFDSSDPGFKACGDDAGATEFPPKVTFKVDGVSTTFTDSGHVLDTHGFDFACLGNESFRWRDIGTTGNPGGTPEPGALTLLGAGLVGLTAFARRRSRRS